MWKICRGAVFSNWAKKWPCQNARQNTKKSVLQELNCDKSKSHKDKNRSQDANNHRKFWDDPHFYCHAFRSTLLETVGFVGTTVALCIDIQHQHCRSPYPYEGFKNLCLFPKFAFSMPHTKRNVLTESGETSLPRSFQTSERFPSQKPKVQKVEEDIDSFLHDMEDLTINYVAAVENQTGLELMNHNDKKKAFKFFKTSASLGCPKALYNLGVCYETGSGTSVNMEKAVFYYKKASDKGHAFATYNLGIYYLQGLGGLPKNTNKGNKLIQKAAKSGLPEAQVYVGTLYLDDNKWSEAYDMFKSAASQNSIAGKYYLGLCYENGWGIVQNVTIAAELYSEAAQNGHEEATFKLGSYYEKGLGGILQDKEFALTLYKMLADQNHAEGKLALHSLKTELNEKWLSLGFKNKNRNLQNVNDDEKKQVLHTSASVPELKSYNLHGEKGLSIPRSSSQYLNDTYPKYSHRYTCKLDEPLVPFTCSDDYKNNHFNTSLKDFVYIPKIPQMLAAGT